MTRMLEVRPDFSFSYAVVGEGETLCACKGSHALSQFEMYASVVHRCVGIK